MGGLILAPSGAIAQIVGDGSLPAPSVVTPAGLTQQITGGTQAGGNLFHSFAQFSVGAGETAWFDQAGGIDRIFARVTGPWRSDIQGTLRANGSTDLYLLNPNGITFGPNAALNLGGSFIASTAQSLSFGDGSLWHTQPGLSSPLLSISVPVGLQLGSSSGTLRVEGPGNDLLDGAISGGIFRANRPDGLRVSDGKTLGLVGNGLELAGGNVSAFAGQLQLWSASQGEVKLTGSGNSISFAEGTVPLAWSDITLSQAASADVSGAQAGQLTAQGKTIRLLDGSALLADTQGAGNGGLLSVQASEAFLIDGFEPTSSFNRPFASGILAVSRPGSSGQGARVQVETPLLRLTNAGRVTTGTASAAQSGDLTIQATRVQVQGPSTAGTTLFGGIWNSVFNQAGATGKGGNFIVNADSIELINGGFLSNETYGFGPGGLLTVNTNSLLSSGLSPDKIPSGFYGSTGSTGKLATAGTIAINAQSILMNDGANLNNLAYGSGNGGAINIKADSLELVGTSSIGPTSISAIVLAGASGNAGSINLDVNTLRLSEGAQISTSTFGQGNGGLLNVQAQQIELSGESSSGSLATSLLAQVEPGATGRGGDIFVVTDQLNINNGSNISTGTFSSGNTGSLSIQAKDIEISGIRQSGRGSSGIFVNVLRGASGNAKTLTLETERLTLKDGGQIASGTAGTGSAGNVVVNASDWIHVTGQSNFVQQSDGSLLNRQSAILASALVDTGSGGGIVITTPRLLIDQGATVSASNFPSISSTDPSLIGKGAAGSIEVVSDVISLDTGGTLSTASAGGDRGNITLNTGVLVMRRGSGITTNAQGTATGGNILINAKYVIAPAQENSDITANAQSNFGGKVTVNALGVFGTQFREFLTPESDITASSALGAQFSGSVLLNTPETPTPSSVTELPSGLVDSSTQIAAGCSTQATGSFVVTGRGGLPEDASGVLRSFALWEDVRNSTSTAEAIPAPVQPTKVQPATSQPTTSQPATIQPAPDQPSSLPKSARIQEASSIQFEPDGRIRLVARSQPSAVLLQSPHCLAKPSGRGAR